MPLFLVTRGLGRLRSLLASTWGLGRSGTGVATTFEGWAEMDSSSVSAVMGDSITGAVMAMSATRAVSSHSSISSVMDSSITSATMGSSRTNG